MCGIAGTIDTNADRGVARARSLNFAQRHRGPDHMAVVRVGPFALANSRLAIQDPGPEGNQPFVSPDGRYYAVFNGEIYNHRDLAERYHLPVRTACDGEVIPHLWAKLGMACLAELRGMYAIALVDSLTECLYLARDPFGIKPLHWRKIPGEGLAFASEIRPLACLKSPMQVDPAAIARLLYLGALAPDQSPFQEISAVPPNSVVIVDRDCRTTVREIIPGGPFAITGAHADL